MSEAILTMYPDPARVKQTPRGEAKLRASRGRGLGSGSKVNTSEPMTNLVNWNVPKMLTGMNQNGMWAGLWTVEFQSKDNSPTGG